MEVHNKSANTPKSERFSRRRSLFAHLENSPQSPKIRGNATDSPREKSITPLPLHLEDDEIVSPIKKTTFYGRSKPKYEPWKREKSASVSPPKRERKENKPAPVKKSNTKYGINKGVSHAIKKPKPQKKEPTTPKCRLTTSQSKTPQTAGKRTSNMSYAIKDGQPSFKIRESPQTTPYFEKANFFIETPNTPKTPKTLFTPSSKTDFMDDLLISPPKSSRRHALPSPVRPKRTSKDDNDNEKEAENSIEEAEVETEEPDECLEEIEKFIEMHKKKDDDSIDHDADEIDLQLELEDNPEVMDDVQEESGDASPITLEANESLVEEFSDGYIAKIAENDCTKIDHLEEVLKMAVMAPSLECSKYVFKAKSQIVGILLAEPLMENCKVYRAEKKKNQNEWSMDEVLSRVSVGISGIWVHEDFRRNKVASRLVKAMEDTFFGHKKLVKGQGYAFAHKSTEGAIFASKYVGHPQGYFLSYSPGK